jgi:hypothetical protein
MAPLPPPDLIGAIAGGVFSYLLEQSGVADPVRARLGLDPTRKAFERALSRAVSALQGEHPGWFGVRMVWEPPSPNGTTNTRMGRSPLDGTVALPRLVRGGR